MKYTIATTVEANSAEDVKAILANAGFSHPETVVVPDRQYRVNVQVTTTHSFSIIVHAECDEDARDKAADKTVAAFESVDGFHGLVEEACGIFDLDEFDFEVQEAELIEDAEEEEAAVK